MTQDRAWPQVAQRGVQGDSSNATLDHPPGLQLRGKQERARLTFPYPSTPESTFVVPPEHPKALARQDNIAKSMDEALADIGPLLEGGGLGVGPMGVGASIARLTRSEMLNFALKDACKLMGTLIERGVIHPGGFAELYKAMLWFKSHRDFEPTLADLKAQSKTVLEKLEELFKTVHIDHEDQKELLYKVQQFLNAAERFMLPQSKK